MSKLTSALTACAALIALLSPAASLADSTPSKANAQGFIRAQLVNGRATIQLVNNKGDFVGHLARITRIWGDDCVTTIEAVDENGAPKSRRIDWSAVTDMGSDWQSGDGFGWEINISGPIRAASGDTVYGSSIFTGLDDPTTQRIFAAMDYLQKQCKHATEGGW